MYSWNGPHRWKRFLLAGIWLGLVACETGQGYNAQQQVDSLRYALMAEKRLSRWSKHYIETVCLPRVSPDIQPEEIAQYLRDNAAIIPVDQRLPKIGLEPLDEQNFRLSTDLAFLPGQYELSENMLERLRPIADSLARRPFVYLRIEGHTDNQELGLDADPELYWNLSFQRARFVARQLEKQGVYPSFIKVSGGGLHYQLASNETEAGRNQNRRVEIYVSVDP